VSGLTYQRNKAGMCTLFAHLPYGDELVSQKNHSSRGSFEKLVHLHKEVSSG